MSNRFASERDFVASFLLPKFKEAARILGKADLVDFHVERPVDGTADLTADKAGKGLFVLEAKFKKKIGTISYDIEPRDPNVINQAVNYAALGGFPYYLTCNTRRIILFHLRSGVKAYESEIASYEYTSSPNWAEEVLKAVLELVPVRLKPVDDSLVDMLHEALSDLYPEFFLALKNKIEKRKFREEYNEWLKNQGLEFNDDNNRLIAEQSTYLQINKLLFFQVIRVIYPDRLSPLKIQDNEDVSEALNRFYEEARAIDYLPIYGNDIISEIPLTIRAKERMRTLLDTLNEFDFSRMESDFLGRVYEKLIPPDERKRLGQYYTSLGIVDFIIALTLEYPNASVLDPGCGSGSFLVRAYHRLKELKKFPQSDTVLHRGTLHKQLLEQIYGIDINQFPAHLSVINLAIQNAKAKIDKVNVIVKDFFDVKPGQATLLGFRSLTTEGKQTSIELPPYFDTIVANPPYIRQELLSEREKTKIKTLIETEYKNKIFVGSLPKNIRLPDAIILNKQSDIYVYFFIHGVSLLRNNGLLGFISSNKWLEVSYGEPFQDFLLKNTKIRFIVEFDRALFPDAEINTAITVLQKEKDVHKRGSNQVKFVRFKKRTDRTTQLRVVQETNESFEDDSVKINVVKQEDLVRGKWNVYLRAPPVYQRIVKHPKMKPLGELAEVFFGIKTGYNDFFILSKDKAREWMIEKEFLKPVVTSPKKIKGLIIHSEDIDEYLFLCHKPKEKLKGTNALEYIKFGEKLKVKIKRTAQSVEVMLPDVPSVRGRKLWYDLPEYELPPIIFQELYDTQVRALWNEIGAHARAPLYYCIPKPGIESEVIVGYLNSSVAQMLLELYGRSYGGGVLDVKVYELKTLPVIDIPRLDDAEKETIMQAFRSLAERMDKKASIENELEHFISRKKNMVGLFETDARRKLKDALDLENESRQELDRAIYEAISLSAPERRQIEKALGELKEIRMLRRKI
jgi:type I restriction-modification system DNA methylase subunit